MGLDLEGNLYQFAQILAQETINVQDVKNVKEIHVVEKYVNKLHIFIYKHIQYYILHIFHFLLIISTRLGNNCKINFI